MLVRDFLTHWETTAHAWNNTLGFGSSTDDKLPAAMEAEAEVGTKISNKRLILVRTCLPLKVIVMMVWISLILRSAFQCSSQAMHQQQPNFDQILAVVQDVMSQEAMLALMHESRHF
ncbi:TPA: hypothetical protein ACH3X3_001243 [Trebouxia sp. C0006]